MQAWLTLSITSWGESSSAELDVVVLGSHVIHPSLVPANHCMLSLGFLLCLGYSAFCVAERNYSVSLFIIFFY